MHMHSGHYVIGHDAIFDTKGNYVRCDTNWSRCYIPDGITMKVVVSDGITTKRTC